MPSFKIMSVPKGKRKESKVEFDNAYFRIYEDCVRLTLCNFGGNETLVEQYSTYIKTMSEEVLKTTCDELVNKLHKERRYLPKE